MISNLKKLLITILLFSILGCNENKTTNTLTVSEDSKITAIKTFFENKHEKFLKILEKEPILTKPISFLISNKKLLSTLFQNPEAQNIIYDKNKNKIFFENFNYILKKELGRKELKEIERDKNYLNYAILGSIYANNKSKALKLYKKLKNSISIELIPSFTLVLNSINQEYNINDLIKNFQLLQYELSTEAIDELAKYPEFFAYFLYPSKKELNIEDISNSKLYQIQQDIEKRVIFLYKEIFQYYRYKADVNQMEYALLTIENIYPYLLEAYNTNRDEFESLFSILIEKDYISSLFSRTKCFQIKVKERFAIFGSNNINNMINFIEKESDFNSKIINELDNSINSLMAFFYIANAHKNLSPKEWKIFKELILTLPLSVKEKTFFVQKIEQSGYFRNIIQKDNFDDFIRNKDYGDGNPKYKFILLTPYPSQKDMTLYEKVLKTNISKQALQQSLVTLISKDKQELEKHEFIMIEKVFGNLNRLDNALTVTSIVLIPFTGGTSLSIIATKIASKAIGAKEFKKNILVKVSKHIDKIATKIPQIDTPLDAKLLVNLHEKIEGIRKINKKIIKNKEKIDALLNNKDISLQETCEEK